MKKTSTAVAALLFSAAFMMSGCHDDDSPAPSVTVSPSPAIVSASPAPSVDLADTGVAQCLALMKNVAQGDPVFPPETTREQLAAIRADFDGSDYADLQSDGVTLVDRYQAMADRDEDVNADDVFNAYVALRESCDNNSA